MNEIRQLCTSSLLPSKHLDEILTLFHACPPQYLLSSLSLIGQSISCMSVEQFDINTIKHQLFVLIRQWSERLFQLWLVNNKMNVDEHRALFYNHQLFKLLMEWLNQQDISNLDHENQEIIKCIITDLFVDENFIRTICRVISQLMTDENDEQHSSATSNLSDDEDQLSPDDIQIQTQTSDDQADQADIVDVLFRCVNSLVILFTHPILLNNTIANQMLTPCLLDCLRSPLFIQLSTKFLRQNLTNEQISIRSIFLLSSCLDYCTLSITSSTIHLLPSIRKILHVWCEIPQNTTEDTSPLIQRLIRFLNRLTLLHQDSIIQENLCAFFVPYFDNLCLTSTIIDDIVSILVTLSTTITGKQHLRRLGYIQSTLHATKRHDHFWHPLALLLTQRDLYQSSLFKKLIHLLTQRTISIFQSLKITSNDTSFDSTTTTSLKDETSLIAIEWFVLLRTSFLSFTMIVDELINYTKKVNLINMIIDTILSLEQENENLSTLIEVLMELLWTFSFSISTNIHEILRKRIDLCIFFKNNSHTSTAKISLASQAMFSILNSNNRSFNRTIFNHQSSHVTNNLICIFYSDESYQELCIALRSRLELEYTVELLFTGTYQSLDLLIQLIDRSCLCLFCASTHMKIDNLAHFIHRYISFQPYSIPILTTLVEDDCELEGSWLETLITVDMKSILLSIRRHLNSNEENDIHFPSQTSDPSIVSHICNISSNELQNQSHNYLQYPVLNWSSNDVTEWCKGTEGSFETIQPLVMRLNGSALVHLAEILSIEPASMYHSLNEELLQRTGTSVPITEYVSFRSELQQLFIYDKNQRMTMTPRTLSENGKMDNHEKKQRKRSRLCAIL